MECIFCKIARGEIPTEKVYEDDMVFAFKDINPAAPVHILIIPKSHVASVMDLRNDNSEVVGHIFMVAQRLAREFNLDEKGFRIVNNCGQDGGQTVFHLHFHLLGGRPMAWPPG